MLPLDPFKFAAAFWPDVVFYREQQEIIRAVRDTREVYVPAGNMLGKDFVAAFIVLWFFLTRHPCRIVTTSAKEDHLRVLWGEMMRYIQTSTMGGKVGVLSVDEGGPLVCNHRELKKIVGKNVCPLSYVRGMVASDQTAAALQGHHIAQTGDGIPRTMFVGDEASALKDAYFDMGSTWGNRLFFFGNTWDCSNFFRRAVEGAPGGIPGGDLTLDGRCVRRVIRVTAEDSPNVRFARAQIAAGLKPTDEIIVPGVLPWSELQHRLATRDKVWQTVSLHARFYRGAENLMFPPDWLDRAEELAAAAPKQRRARAIGCDPGEGGADTAWAVVDEYGLIELIGRPTPDTSVIPRETLALMRKYSIPGERVGFDRGGGGKQVADTLRSQGHPVRTVSFGTLPTLPLKRGLYTIDTRRDLVEERTVYRSCRSEMYDTLRQLMDPDAPAVWQSIGGMDKLGIREFRGFGFNHAELRRQLAPIPLTYDREGRLELLPKRNLEHPEKSLMGLIGRSPDEADAVVVAVHIMLNRVRRSVAGAA